MCMYMRVRALVRMHTCTSACACATRSPARMPAFHAHALTCTHAGIPCARAHLHACWHSMRKRSPARMPAFHTHARTACGARTWKHSQYFFRQWLRLQLQPFLWRTVSGSVCWILRVKACAQHTRTHDSPCCLCRSRTCSPPACWI